MPRIHYLGSFSILENHKLHRIKDLHKTLYKISMISITYNTIKSYYAKSAMREKKEWNRMLFYRSSHRRCSMEKDVLRNFTKFTEKNLCQSLTFRPATFLRKKTVAQVFSCEFCKISKGIFFYRTRLDDCF